MVFKWGVSLLFWGAKDAPVRGWQTPSLPPTRASSRREISGTARILNSHGPRFLSLFLLHCGT